MSRKIRWYFSKEQIRNTPSRKNKINADKELGYRQQSANIIEDIGQRLRVSRLCISTAIVYMHRFYMFHSMTHFYRNKVALTCLFLATKVEEERRKLDHVITLGEWYLRHSRAKFNINVESQEIVLHESILLKTLGYDVLVEHPHMHVIRGCKLFRASKDLAKTSYLMATNTLHLTMMCVKYKPTAVACFCIYLASKWTCWEIQACNEGRPWFYYIDPKVTLELLEYMTAEFLNIYNKYPSKLRRMIKIMYEKSKSRPVNTFNPKPKDILHGGATAMSDPRSAHSSVLCETNQRQKPRDKVEVNLRPEERKELIRNPVRPSEQQQKENISQPREETTKPNDTQNIPAPGPSADPVPVRVNVVEENIESSSLFRQASSYSLGCNSDDLWPSTGENDEIKSPQPSRQRSKFSPESTPEKNNSRPLKYKLIPISLIPAKIPKRDM